MAALANVSITTVSRTINDPSLVDPETATRVLAAIQKKGYFPNSQARSLVSGKSRILGLILSDITNPFFPEIVHSFEEMAIGKGYEILIASTGYDSHRMATCVRRMLERKVDAVAIMTSEMEPDLIEQLVHRRVPMVFLDVGKVGPGISNLVVDYPMGIHAAAEHLIGLGHQRIGFISGFRKFKSARIRRSAFLSSLRRYGLDFHIEAEGDHQVSGGVAAMEKLLSLANPPTAVLASNDLTALGAMRAVRKAGLSVPGDVSIVGFDDIGLAEYTDPPLTTVRLPRRELAQRAFEAVVLGINDPSQGVEFRIETQLIVRETTAKPPR